MRVAGSKSVFVRKMSPARRDNRGWPPVLRRSLALDLCADRGGASARSLYRRGAAAEYRQEKNGAHGGKKYCSHRVPLVTPSSERKRLVGVLWEWMRPPLSFRAQSRNLSIHPMRAEIGAQRPLPHYALFCPSCRVDSKIATDSSTTLGMTKGFLTTLGMTKGGGALT